MKGLSGINFFWMIRHEDNFLVLILYHEVFEVLPSSFTLKVTKTQEGLMHVVWINHTDLRYLFSLHDGAHM